MKVNIETFVFHCRKLQKRFGEKKLNREFLNELWSQMKKYDDEYIVNATDKLIDKPLDHSFTIDQFINLGCTKKRSVYKDVVRDEKSFDKPYMSDSGFKRAMSEFNADNVIDAFNNARQRTRK